MSEPINGEPVLLRQPTEENLRRDAASIAQQVHDAWDGEVEVIVILTPTKQLMPDVCAARSVRSTDRYVTILTKALERARHPFDYRKK